MIKEGQITLNPQHFTTALNSSDKLLPNYRVLSVGFPYRCKGSNIIFSGKTIKIFSDSWHNASKCEYLLSLLDDANVMLLFFSGKTKKVFSGSQFNSAQSEYFLSLIDEANVMLIFLLAKQKTRSVVRSQWQWKFTSFSLKELLWWVTPIFTEHNRQMVVRDWATPIFTEHNNHFFGTVGCDFSLYPPRCKCNAIFYWQKNIYFASCGASTHLQTP